MTRSKDLPKIRNPRSGEGHNISYRDMKPSELAEYEARQQAYEAMLARQAAYERAHWPTEEKTPPVISEVQVGLKLRLEWYDKQTESFEGEEYSNDSNDDVIFNSLGIPYENNINNGGFNILQEWVGILQPHFQHPIDRSRYDYQISFDYRDRW